jgi:hypothetical protein
MKRALVALAGFAFVLAYAYAAARTNLPTHDVWW